MSNKSDKDNLSKETKNIENGGVENVSKENQSQVKPFDSKNKKILKTILTCLILIVPVVIIIYRSFNNKDTAANSTNSEHNPVINEQNDPKLAEITNLENAVKRSPDFKNLLNLSLAYIKERKPEKSIEPLKKAIALEPNNVAAYNNLGTAYNLMHSYKDGIAYCTKAVQLDSTFRLAKNNLNWVKSEEKKSLLTIKTMEAMPENKRKPDYFITLAMQYSYLQEYNKSIELYNKSIKANLKSTEAWNNLGVLYMSLQNYDESIKCFKKATEIDPTFQLAKNNFEYTLREQDRFLQSQKGN